MPWNECTQAIFDHADLVAFACIQSLGAAGNYTDGRAFAGVMATADCTDCAADRATGGCALGGFFTHRHLFRVNLTVGQIVFIATHVDTLFVNDDFAGSCARDHHAKHCCENEEKFHI